MTKASTSPPKIIINGVGNVGRRLIRFCDMKGWPIVAAYNRAGEKIGQDIGQLAGLGRNLGVAVQDAARADYPAVKADIALNTVGDLLHLNYPIYERFLGAGINVLCHGTQCYSPFFENAAVAGRIDALAKANGVTFCGTGIWDTTRVWAPIIAAGTCLSIESVVHTAQAEIGRQGVQFERLCAGVGLSLDEYMTSFVKTPTPYTLNRYVHGPVVMVLQKLGCTIENVRKYDEPIVFDEPVYSPFSKQEFPAGIVVGTRNNVEVTTREGIRGGAILEYRLFRPGEIEELRWDISGLPGLRISVERKDTANLSAAALFNRIPDVLAAGPGIVEITKMGPLTSTALHHASS
jgi:2,4-diaminopentanoate dehydrogenase